MRLLKTFGMMLLAGAVVFGTAEVSEAARGGRGGRGGGYGGGGYGGRGYGGGYGGRGYYGGYGRGYGGFGFGYPYGYGYGYGYSPSYYSDGYYSEPAYSSGYESYYPSSTVIADDSAPQNDMTAHVTVRVPASAEVWFNGKRMNATGTVREFATPALTSGGRFTYEARARWMENGREMSQTQEIAVTPGAHVNVMFPTRTNVAQ